AWPVPIFLTLIGLRVRSTILFRGIAVAGVLVAGLVLLALAGPFAGPRTFGTLVGAFMLLAWIARSVAWLLHVFLLITHSISPNELSWRQWWQDKPAA